MCLVGKRQPRWKEYGTLRNVGLSARDYLAGDWEVLSVEDSAREVRLCTNRKDRRDG